MLLEKTHSLLPCNSSLLAAFRRAGNLLRVGAAKATLPARVVRLPGPARVGKAWMQGLKHHSSCSGWGFSVIQPQLTWLSLETDTLNFRRNLAGREASFPQFFPPP